MSATQSANLSPIVSEFETHEQESLYNAWFVAKVQEAFDDQRPMITHDEVSRRMEKRLAKLKATALVAH
jgi:hypothetical protein